MPSHRAVTMEELTSFLHLPEKVVAKQLGICLTSLKKLCRQHGIYRWPYRKLKSLDKKMAKGEASAESDTTSHSAKAEEIKKEKIAVALTYGTSGNGGGAASASPFLLSASVGEPAMNSPRSNAQGPAPTRGPEPGPAAGPASDHPTATPSPRSPVSSPAPSDGRPIRARRATPAAAALLENAKAARERQNRSKEPSKSSAAAAAAAAAAEEEAARRSKGGRGARRCGGAKSAAAAAAVAASAAAVGKAARAGKCAKRSRAGRRKAIPTPPDDGPRSCSDHDGGALSDTAGDGMEAAGMLDDHGGYDAHGGPGGSGRLWGLGGLREHSLDDGESPSARNRPDMTGRDKSHHAAGFDSDMEIASALAAAVSAPRPRASPLAIPPPHAPCAAGTAPHRPLAHVQMQLAQRIAGQAAAAAAAAAAAQPPTPHYAAEEAPFGGDLIHDGGGGERDLLHFFCQHEHAGDSEDTVLLDARHEDSPNPSVESASSVRTAPDFELSAVTQPLAVAAAAAALGVSPAARDGADWFLAPSTPDAAKAANSPDGSLFPAPRPPQPHAAASSAPAPAAGGGGPV